MKNQGQYSEKPYRREFGTWSEAVEEAGYEPHRPGKYVAENAEKKCAYCGDRFTRLASSFDEAADNYFCSNECKDRHHEEHDGGESHPLHDRVTVECSWCGDKLSRKPSVVNEKENFFCNRGDCYSQWCSDERTGENHPRWKGGRVPYYGPNWRQKRREVRERDDYKCRRCGKTETESKEETDKTVEVHHREKSVREFYDELEIDPEEVEDWANTSLDWDRINALDNLVTLCSSCHQKIEKLPVTPQFD